MAPATPTSKLLSPRPVLSSCRAADIEPTMVTSSPSRIQTVPSPITTSQCHRAHGSLSSRAGISVVIRPVSTPDAMVRLPFSDVGRKGEYPDAPEKTLLG